MRIERAFCMPDRWTFRMRPVRDLLREEIADSRPWIDPFAGRSSPAHMTNDLDPSANATYHMDALEFLHSQKSASFAGALFDPPYSLECTRRKYGSKQYKDTASFSSYVFQCKREIARLIAPGGKVICCGWNSNGIGKKAGFELERVLLLAHAGHHSNDTIITVERRIQYSLNPGQSKENCQCLQIGLGQAGPGGHGKIPL